MGTDTDTTLRNGMRTFARGLIRYDAIRKRVWVGPQRLHHGLTGALLASAGLAGLATHKVTPKGGLEWALFGTALMAHDWHDRSVWFELGPQSDD